MRIDLLRCLAGVALSSLLLHGLTLRAAAGTYENDIRRFEASDATNPPPANAILFVGSSSIRMWNGLPTAFPGHTVIQRGFGGSHMADLLEYMDRIVIPYRPSVILVYEGDNDIASGKSPERLLSEYKQFVTRVRQHLPKTKIAYISTKPSPARAKWQSATAWANDLIRDFSKEQGLLYVDVFTPILDAQGRPRPEFFLADQLHLNEQGYAVWVSVIRPILDKAAK